jgi:hypothetical protein
MIPVKGHDNLYRDPSNGAIINRDKTNAGIAREARKRIKEDHNRIDQLENDLSIIKDLLNKLLEKK